MARLIGTVTHVVGEVFVVGSNGTRHVLVEGDRLFAGEQLQTGAVGAVAVHLANGGELTLGRDSSMPLTQEILTGHASHIDTPDATTPSRAQLTDVEQLQKAIAAGDDPTKTAEAAAAGPGADGPNGPLGGGHSFVVLSEVAGHVDPVFGFSTAGFIGIPEFPDNRVVGLDRGSPEATVSPPPAGAPPIDHSITLTGLDVSGGELNVYECNLANGSHPDASALTQSGTFTVTAHDGLQSLKVGGIDVVLGGAVNGFPQSIITGLGNTLTVIGYNAETGVVSYSYTLQHAEAQPYGQGANSISEHLTVVAINGDGDAATGTLDVNIVDDVPTAHADSGHVTEGGTISGNVLDNDIAGADGPGPSGLVVGARAGSDTSHPAFGGLNTSIEGAFGTLIIDAFGTATYHSNPNSVNAHGADDVFTYSIRDADGDVSTTTLTISVCDSGLKAVNDCDVTVFESALDLSRDCHDLAPGTVVGSHPYSPAETGSGTLVGSVIHGGPGLTFSLVGSNHGTLMGHYGEIHLNSDGTYTYTLTSAPKSGPADDGPNVVSESFTYKATDALGNSVTAQIFVSIVDDVPRAACIDRSVTSTHADSNVPLVTGSLLTGGTFGADGGFIKAIIVDGVSYLYDPKANGNRGGLSVVGGVSHGTFDTVTNSVTVASHNGGTLMVDMDTGEYTYTPPKATCSTTLTEHFGYVISDNDGDLASANLLVRVNPNAPPVAVDDHIITNLLSPVITVPAEVLLANDRDPDGDHLSAAPTTFNTGWVAKGADFTAVNSKAINFTCEANTDANQFKNLDRSDFFNNTHALTALVVLNGYLGAVNGATANAQDLYSVTLHKGETVTLDNNRGDGHVQMEWQDSHGNSHCIADGGTFTATEDGVYLIHVTNIANTSGSHVNAAETYQLHMLVNYAGAQDVTPDYHGSYTVSDGHGGSASAAVSIVYQAGHTLLGTTGDDVLIAGPGDNHLHGGDGNDVLKAGAGNNELFGDNGNDLLFSGPGNDLLDGGAGINTVSYATATSAVHVDLNIITEQNTGGAGHDTLVNIQNLTGSHYNDTLMGGYDNNVLNGGLGNDILNGRGGDDVLIGGLGNNTLTGGSGSDTFKWEQGNVGHDVVTDFSIGVDKLDLSQLLQGENASAASLDDYLHFKVTGSGASLVTTIEVSSIAGASPTQTIDLAGVNLATHYGVAPGAGGVVAGGHDTASIINGMISDHSLKVDTV